MESVSSSQIAQDSPLPYGYEKLMKHLPTSVKEALEAYILSARDLDVKYMGLQKGVSFYVQKSIEKISRIAIACFRAQKLTLEETASLHMYLAAYEELVLNPKMTMIYNSSLERTVFTVYLSNLAPKRSIHISRYTIDYLSSNRSLFENQDNFDDQTLSIPFAKRFFSFSDPEWEEFCDQMKNVSLLEKKCYLFSLPIGCWAPVYDRMCEMIRCLHPLTVYEMEEGYIVSSEKMILIPSFSMLQIFLNVKAATKKRKPMKLVPVFGELSLDDVEKLKKNGETPLGLYCPVPRTTKIHRHFSFIDPDITKSYMRTVDGWEGNGPLSFWLHDCYHAIREQEITENISNARFYIISLLKKYLKKHPEKIKEVMRARHALVDGELIFSYDNKETLFIKDEEDEGKSLESFGSILDDEEFDFWTPAIKKLVIKDMVVNSFIWLEKFQISFLDLHAQEKKIFVKELYERCVDFSFLLSEKKPNQNYFYFEISELNQEEYISNATVLKLCNAKLNSLRCDSAQVANCTIEKIKATGNLVIKEQNEIKKVKVKGNLMLASRIKSRISCKGNMTWLIPTKTKKVKLQNVKSNIITFNSDSGIEKVIIKDNCHISNILFEGTQMPIYPRKMVILKNGAKLTGKVLGGNVIQK